MKVTVSISIAWWFRWIYLPGAALISAMTGQRPDHDKLSRMVDRACKVRIK